MIQHYRRFLAVSAVAAFILHALAAQFAVCQCGVLCLHLKSALQTEVSAARGESCHPCHPIAGQDGPVIPGDGEHPLSGDGRECPCEKEVLTSADEFVPVDFRTIQPQTRTFADNDAPQSMLASDRPMLVHAGPPLHPSRAGPPASPSLYLLHSVLII